MSGTLAALLVVLLGLWLFLRKPAYAMIAMAGVLVPVTGIGLLMHLAGIEWSIALLALPAFAIGFAVDDAIHLSGGLRRHPRSTRGSLTACALHAGPALIGTSVILVACMATLLGSGLIGNREFAYLVAGVLLIALICNLTLLPALFRIWSRRSVRRCR